MSIVLDGTTGITTPGLTNTGTETIVNLTTTGNTTLGDATTDTLTVGVTGIVKDASGNVGIGTASPNANSKLDVAGISQSSSASYPAFQLYNSGLASNAYFRIAYDSANNLVFNSVNNAYNSSTEYMRINSSGNVGIGTTSPSYKLDVSGAATATPVTNGIIRILTTGSNPPTGYGGGLVFSQVDSSAVNRDYASITGSRVNSSASNQVDMVFSTGDPGGGSVPITERMRLTTSGNLLIGTGGGSLPNGTSVYGSAFDDNGASTKRLRLASSVTTTIQLVSFYNPNGNVGNITTNASATAYATSSDYRLKEDITPMTGALNKISALKPVTYKWKADGSDGEGFIAHELSEVVPQCVIGEKDAVDAEGNPVYQGIDTSFLVATLTAAIQEQQALITALTARITALETP